MNLNTLIETAEKKGKEWVKNQNQKNTTLKITKVRYFKTRRGVGYECNTNHPGVKVWNDGQGGETYLTETNPSRLYDNLNEWDLEKLIDIYENIKR
tara:strand:+ start:4247 stop:4534 length:288 start_codon:yes stop_codon:yes gene_type:complete